MMPQLVRSLEFKNTEDEKKEKKTVVSYGVIIGQ